MNSEEELRILIWRVHESMEGRYSLTGEDLHNIHALLCRIQKPNEDLRDFLGDDNWVHDVDMGAR